MPWFVGYSRFGALRDALGFYSLIAAAGVRPGVDLPLSLLMATLLAAIAITALRHGTADASRRRHAVAVAASAASWLVIFPLAQMLFFGTTDYRRPADVAVIFGARVYANGQPAPLLADRIRAGIELYRDGIVPRLIVSGGDGADGFNEATVMRDVAVAAGLGPGAILVDPSGDTTEATVHNAMALIDSLELPDQVRVIAVSQAYHLPRVQLSFASAGLDVLTVPAVEAEPIREMPLFIAREIPAFWAYYVRVCLG